MSLDSKPYTFDRIFRIFVSVLIFAVILWLMRYLSDVLIPFAMAFLLAYLLNPLVNVIQNKIKHRIVSVLTALGLVSGLLFLAGFVTVPVIKKEVFHMSKLIVRVAEDKELSKRALNYVPAGLWESVRSMAKGEEMGRVREILGREDVWMLLQAAGKKILPGLWKMFQGAASLIFAFMGIFVVFLYLVFLLIDYQNAREGWKSLVPSKWHSGVEKFVFDFDTGMSRHFRAQALVAASVGILFSLGFMITGLPMALFMGFLVGVLNMVPYLQIVAIIPACLLAVVQAVETGSGLFTTVGLTLLVFAVVQTIQDSFLTPRIMGKVTGLSPAIILLSVSVWGKLMGVFGLIIALPMTCLLLAYYKRLIEPEEKESGL